MADESVIISNLPTHTPAGSDYLAIEDSSVTGKNTVNTIVAAAAQVQTNASAISQLNSNRPIIALAGDGAVFGKNFLLIDGYQDGPLNARASWHWMNASDRANFTNLPVALASETEALGIREVIFLDNVHIMVRVTEFFPIPGRVHWCFLNFGTWTAWNVQTPTTVS